jgi:hypothetical protein
LFLFTVQLYEHCCCFEFSRLLIYCFELVGFRTAAVNYDSRLKITKGGNTTIGNAQIVLKLNLAGGILFDFLIKSNLNLGNVPGNVPFPRKRDPANCNHFILFILFNKAQHLSNQCYEICIRRESSYCSICYWPNIIPATGEPGQVKLLPSTSVP